MTRNQRQHSANCGYPLVVYQDIQFSQELSDFNFAGREGISRARKLSIRWEEWAKRAANGCVENIARPSGPGETNRMFLVFRSRSAADPRRVGYVFYRAGRQSAVCFSTGFALVASV